MTLAFSVGKPDANGVSKKWYRNSLNSVNLINHWDMNKSQFKDPFSHMCLILVSYTRGGWVPGSSPFTVMTNNFVTEFSENIYIKLKYHQHLWVLHPERNCYKSVNWVSDVQLSLISRYTIRALSLLPVTRTQCVLTQDNRSSLYPRARTPLPGKNLAYIPSQCTHPFQQESFPGCEPPTSAATTRCQYQCGGGG